MCDGATQPAHQGLRRPAGSEKYRSLRAPSVAGMNLTLSHCFVNVSDPDEALAFYRDVLELTVRTDVSAEGFRWVTLSPPSQPEVEIVLMEPGSGPGRADRETLLALLAKGSRQGLI